MAGANRRLRLDRGVWIILSLEAGELVALLLRRSCAPVVGVLFFIFAFSWRVQK